MLFANLLRSVLDRTPPDICIFEVLDHHAVNLVAEVLYRSMGSWQHNRLIIVWQLALNIPVLILAEDQSDSTYARGKPGSKRHMICYPTCCLKET